MDKLIRMPMEKRNGSGKHLKIIEWIASHDSTQCDDFAHKLFKDRLTVKKLRKKSGNDDEFVRAVFDKWLSIDDDNVEDWLPCTWKALVQCAEEANLDGEFVMLLRDNVPRGESECLIHLPCTLYHFCFVY